MLLSSSSSENFVSTQKFFEEAKQMEIRGEVDVDRKVAVA